MVAILNQLKFRLPLLIFSVYWQFTVFPNLHRSGSSALPHREDGIKYGFDPGSGWSKQVVPHPEIDPLDCAFRMNHSWVANWSSGSFPSGKGYPGRSEYFGKERWKTASPSTLTLVIIHLYHLRHWYLWLCHSWWLWLRHGYVPETSDTISHSLSIQLTDGEVIFRANDAWVLI